MKMIICTMNVRGSVNPILNSENSFAAMSTIAILTNSEGCREMGPSLSQRWAPNADKPMIAVSNSSATATPQMTQMAGPSQKR